MTDAAPETIRDAFSPHSVPRARPITAVVLHDTGGDTAEGAIQWFQDPASKVSAHYVIDRDGITWRCVPEERVAWHAGTSELHGEVQVNDFSIGIELVDRSPDPYPHEQMTALIGLTADLVTRYEIPLNRIVGHQHIARPPGRKVDPGPDFEWRWFLLGVAFKLMTGHLVAAIEEGHP